MSKRPFILGGTNRGRGHKRQRCSKCGKRGLGAMKPGPSGPFFECQYCRGVSFADQQGRPE